MDGTYYNPGDIMMNYQNYYSLQHTQETFRALVDAIIPRTPELAEEYGRIQYYGALDLYTDEYMIMTLNHYYIPIAGPAAEMLDEAAEQLVYIDENNNFQYLNYTEEGRFAALEPADRFRTITLLEQLNVYLANLPVPFQDNPGFVLYIISSFERFTMLGYYSEWSGYGTTRLNSPNQRVLEYFPISWEQVGYPGPSLGYRALRVNNYIPNNSGQSTS